MLKVQTRLKYFENDINIEKVTLRKFNPDEIVITAIAFGGLDRLGELKIMMKSAIIMVSKYHSTEVILASSSGLLAYKNKFYNNIEMIKFLECNKSTG